MHSVHVTRGLWWKEQRQSRPLILTLIGIGSLLVLFGLLVQQSAGITVRLAEIVPWTLPMLFAVGIGAMLVGDEKERQTLWWLESLPIQPDRIVIVKVGAALAGLAVMWCVSGLLIAIVGQTALRPVGVAFQPLVFQIFRLVLHSIFLLGCGFVAAWWFRTTFLSLCAIVPLAAIPFLIVQAVWGIRYIATGKYRVSAGWVDAVSMTALLIGIAATYTLIWRVGIRELRPAPPPRLEGSLGVRLKNIWTPPSAASASTAPFRHAANSMTWQMVRNNGSTLLGIGLAMVAGAWALPPVASAGFNRQELRWLFLPIAVGAPATSWLGVLVFAGAGSANRLRFLADRGVSPAMVWSMRQLVGLSVVATTVLVYACSQAVTTLRTDFPLPSVAMFALSLWVVYSVSQWISQLLPTLGLSAVLAPVLALIGLCWLVFSATQLQAPLWVLVPVAALPMLGTLWSMRRFMDGTRPVSYWCTAVAIVALFVLLPVASFMAQVAAAPGMPDEMRTRLQSEAEQIRPQATLQLVRNELPIHGDFAQQSISGAEALAIYQRTDLNPQARFTNWGSGVPEQGISIEPGMILDAATLELLKYGQNVEDEQQRESLNLWMTFIIDVVAGMRASHVWSDQESADALEIWLLRIVSSDVMKPLRTEEWYHRAVNQLADQSARSDRRRIAVIASWRRSNQLPSKSKPGSKLGGYQIGAAFGSATFRYWNDSKAADAVAAAAIRLIDAGSSGGPTESIRRELHGLIVGDRIRFEDGPYGDRIRTGSHTDFAFSVDQTVRYPANQWYADWERDAIRFAERAHGENSDDQLDHQETPQ